MKQVLLLALAVVFLAGSSQQYNLVDKLNSAYDDIIKKIINYDHLLKSTSPKKVKLHANQIQQQLRQQQKTNTQKPSQLDGLFIEAFFSNYAFNSDGSRAALASEDSMLWRDFVPQILNNRDLLHSLPENYISALAEVLSVDDAPLNSLQKRSALAAFNETGPTIELPQTQTSANCSNVGYERRVVEEAYNCSGTIVSKQKFKESSEYYTCDQCSAPGGTSSPLPEPTSIPVDEGVNATCLATCCTETAPIEVSVCECPADRSGSSCQTAARLDCTVTIEPKYDCDSSVVLSYEDAKECPVFDRNTDKFILTYGIKCESSQADLGPLGNFTYVYNSSDLVLTTIPNLFLFVHLADFHQLWDNMQTAVLGPLQLVHLNGSRTLSIIANMTQINSLRVPFKIDYTVGNRMYFESWIFAAPTQEPSNPVIEFLRIPTKNVFLNLTPEQNNSWMPQSWSAGVWFAIALSIVFVVIVVPVTIWYFWVWKPNSLKPKLE